MSGHKLKPGWGHSSISKALALQEWGSRLDPKNMLFFRGGRQSQQCTLGVLVLGTWREQDWILGLTNLSDSASQHRVELLKEAYLRPSSDLHRHTHTHIRVCPHTCTHVYMHKHRKVRILKPVILPPWILNVREGRWFQRQKTAASIPTVHRPLRSPHGKAWLLEIRRFATVAKK